MTEHSQPIAWVHEEDPSRAISALQKTGMLRGGGAGASSVRPYSIAAFGHAAPQSGAKVLTEEEIHTLALRAANAAATAGGDRLDAALIAIRTLLAIEQPIAASARLNPALVADDQLLVIARRNLHAYLSKASFATNVDRQAALTCLEVLGEALDSIWRQADANQSSAWAR